MHYRLYIAKKNDSPMTCSSLDGYIEDKVFSVTVRFVGIFGSANGFSGL